jgi:hypothetical protein
MTYQQSFTIYEEHNTMNDNRSARRKSLVLASIAYGAFTAISIIGPIILDRLWRRK